MLLVFYFKFLAVLGLCCFCEVSVPAMSRGCSLVQCSGFPRCGAQAVIVVHGLSCSAACGIFRDQGSNQCPWHGQEGSYPLCHQGSLVLHFILFCSRRRMYLKL